MNTLTQAFLGASARARAKRGNYFRSRFAMDASTKILDLGSENGDNIANVLQGTGIMPGNVYIADISRDAVEAGSRRHGFQAVTIDESGRLPFKDGFFDIVYCSSVIEHVTLPKERIWQERSGRRFREDSLKRQDEFARELRRIGRQYFVQSPYRHFPIESHTWLPGLQGLPRGMQNDIASVTNKYWVKASIPDWSLLDRGDMRQLFPEADIVDEKFFGLTKSIMAIKTAA